jgi:hypothetical protein
MLGFDPVTLAVAVLLGSARVFPVAAHGTDERFRACTDAGACPRSRARTTTPPYD